MCDRPVHTEKKFESFLMVFELILTNLHMNFSTGIVPYGVDIYTKVRSNRNRCRSRMLSPDCHCQATYML